jgi:hypothetical protein
MAAGVAALLRAQQPMLKPADVTNLLASKASSLCGTSIKQVDAAATLGLAQLNAPPCRALLPVVVTG